jgi:CIC family chloride channel protein
VRRLLVPGRRLATFFDFRSIGTWLLLGTVLGVVAGVGAILFQMAFEAVRLFCFQSLIGIAPGHPGGEPPDFRFPLAPAFSPYWLVALPALGGLLSGLLVFTFAPEAKGHGTDAAIKAYHRKAGLIRGRVPIVKFFATVLTMGTGGSGGREGPIAQIGAGFGSFLATRLGLSVKYRRMMLAAGLGAGVGAIFRAPLAGALFAAEVLYSDPDVETEVILPAAVTTIVAYAVFAAKYGYGQMFTGVADVGFSNPLELGPYPHVRLDDSVAVAHRLMTSKGVDELLVVDDADTGRLVGVLTSSDVLLAYNRRLAQVEEERVPVTGASVDES